MPTKASRPHKRATIPSPDEARRHFTWLHLSDWHQGKPDYDRKILLQKMLKDIANRCDCNPALKKVDVTLFTGDVAYSGSSDEYAQVQKELIKPLEKILGPTRFVFAPGNHDLDRAQLPSIPHEWNEAISCLTKDRQKALGNMLYDKKSTAAILAPFDNFYAFSASNGCDYRGAPVFSAQINRDDKIVAVAAINSAICSGRHTVHRRKSSDGAGDDVWDYGVLSISERQLRDAIKKVEHAEVKVLLMHHPVSWMHDSEQPLLQQLISSNFDLIFFGHEHLPRVEFFSPSIAHSKHIPAGSAYSSRYPGDPRFTNAFNFGVLDLDRKEGTIHHRRWSEENDEWKHDDRLLTAGIGYFDLKSKMLPPTHQYIPRVPRRYKQYHGYRPARRAEITLKHNVVEIAGQTFIRATVRSVLELHPGPPETYKFHAFKNQRILEHPIKEVRNQAFVRLHLEPKPKQSIEKGKTTFSVQLTSDVAKVVHHYTMLEYPDGVWFFNFLPRFVDYVKINIQKAPGFKYENLSFGGFPELKLGPDGVLSYETFESDRGHLPHEGFIIQWYPEGYLPATRAAGSGRKSKTGKRS
jgi:3',5'-cyclic AMP phosphodiesterase CpdA